MQTGNGSAADDRAANPPLSTGKRLIFWGVLVLLLLIPVAASEFYLRSVGLGTPIVYYTNASYRYAPQPNQKSLRREGATVTIDGQGLRGTKEWSASADAKILFVGDSITYGGSYIDDKDTFANGTCVNLEKLTGKRLVCGNAGVNAYGTDNMAARIRYKTFNDEAAVVVTVHSLDTLRGLTDLGSVFYFTRPLPGPFKGVWEAGTFLVWSAFNILRPLRVAYRPDDDLRVAQRSLENLFAALRERYGNSQKVLIVLTPSRDELNGHETELTKHVRAVLATSGFDVLDLHQAVSAAVTGGFYYDGTHLDVAGHRFYAEQIANRLSPTLKR